MPYAAAAECLRAADPKLARVIDAVGPCQIGEHKWDSGLFEYLTRVIIFQQISGSAGRSIHGKLMALFPEKHHPEPLDFVGATDEQLRSAGVSPQKAKYLRDLGAHAVGGLPTLEELRGLPDAEIIETLTRIKGIGRWTVEMLLLFRLGRMDVWPVDDTGVRNGLKALHSLETAPTAKEAEPMGDPWRPYRSVAAWYLWQSLEVKPP